ncbi:MAG: hypothetical protein CMP76_00820 [Flavobacterium sp.]|uniref:hypothetical protein n=1 Tax=unclassified Flavobacterium TaxID=196869 RepID=UPI000C54E0EE|nr:MULTISPECIES: hypothetical protein [unclassified Flavobacterium]MBF01817.1 hypothetical protein [Flavobacterium sp.]MCO6161406.1 hypothetical protein [Flavobacterium sp. NRK F7]|tara:strand:+ start:2834 stop:3229 length:396 start_codon:yes stop_codon:yes gene_type:complete
MGLAEKRLAATIQTDALPKFISEIQEVATYPIAITIDWETFTAFDTYPLSRLENYVFNDVKEAIGKICSDAIGKEALQESVTTIHIRNTDQQDNFSMELKDKTLFLTERLYGDTFSNHMTNMIVDYLESVL